MSKRYPQFKYNDSPWYYHPIYRKYWEQYDQLRDSFRNVVSNPSFFEERHVRAQHQAPHFLPRSNDTVGANRFLPFGDSIPYRGSTELCQNCKACRDSEVADRRHDIMARHKIPVFLPKFPDEMDPNSFVWFESSILYRGSSKSCRECKTRHNSDVADRRHEKGKKHSHHTHKTACFTNNHVNNKKSTRKHRSENRKGVSANMNECYVEGDQDGPAIPKPRSEIKRKHNKVRVLPTDDESGSTTRSDEANTKLSTSENNRKSKHQNFISELPDNSRAKRSFPVVDPIPCTSSRSNMDNKGRHDLEITDKKSKKGKKHSHETDNRKPKHQNFISELPDNSQAKCSFPVVDPIPCTSSKSKMDNKGRHDLEITDKKSKRGKKHSHEIHGTDHLNNKELLEKNDSENESNFNSLFGPSLRHGLDDAFVYLFYERNSAKREPAKIPSDDEPGGWTTCSDTDTDEENTDSLTSESVRLKLSELQVSDSIPESVANKHVNSSSASSVNYENTYEFDEKDKKNKREKLHSDSHKSNDYANNPLNNRRSPQNNYSRNASYHAENNMNTDSVDEDFCAFIRETRRHQRERDAFKSLVNYEIYEKPLLTEEPNFESHSKLYGKDAPAIIAMEMDQYAKFKHVVDEGKHVPWPYLPMNP